MNLAVIGFGFPFHQSTPRTQRSFPKCMVAILRRNSVSIFVDSTQIRTHSHICHPLQHGHQSTDPCSSIRQTDKTNQSNSITHSSTISNSRKPNMKSSDRQNKKCRIPHTVRHADMQTYRQITGWHTELTPIVLAHLLSIWIERRTKALTMTAAVRPNGNSNSSMLRRRY